MRWNGESVLSARRLWLRAALTTAWLGAALSGCIVSDNRCSENQVELKGYMLGCVCAEGTVPDPGGYGCVKCAEHEEAVNGACECTSGFARAAADMPCEAVTGSLIGAACSADQPCSDPYPYCATLAGDSFCSTQDCKVNADCPADFGCHSEGASKFCAKPVGFGKSCEGPADCAGSEATLCQSFQEPKVCIIEKCAANPSVCPSGNVCCDLSALIGMSLCVPNRSLTNGVCADGKAPVAP